MASAADARALKQDIYTVSSVGNNPIRRTYVWAQAREAESKANAQSAGIFHNEAKMVSTAGGYYPTARNQAATKNSQQNGGIAQASGGAPGFNINTFGTIALSATDTDRALAVSGSETMPVNPTGQFGNTKYKFASSTTANTWGTNVLLRGSGNSRNQWPASVSVNSLPPLSAGISNVGGGPMAVAAAGDAVAFSAADKPDNGFNARR